MLERVLAVCWLAEKNILWGGDTESGRCKKRSWFYIPCEEPRVRAGISGQKNKIKGKKKKKKMFLIYGALQANTHIMEAKGRMHKKTHSPFLETRWKMLHNILLYNPRLDGISSLKTSHSQFAPSLQTAPSEPKPIILPCKFAKTFPQNSSWDGTHLLSTWTLINHLLRSKKPNYVSPNSNEQRIKGINK